MIIGLAGKAGAGKDTVALLLHNNYGFSPLAFADNLKLLCRSVFKVNKKQCYDPEFKERKFATPIKFTPEAIEKICTYAEVKNGFTVSEEQRFKMYKYVGELKTFKTPRELLQFIGTEILREIIDDEYHVKVVKSKMMEDQLYVITDARFENERTKVNEWEGKTVYIERPSNKKDVGFKNHASENSLGQLTDYDFVISNSGSIDDLALEVDRLVNNL